jgi:hypothetical protein
LFQMMIDFMDINALNALYISICIGITLRFFWAWNVKCSFFDSLSDPTNNKIIHPLFFYKQTRKFNQNYILIRIIKYIRRKKYSRDDSEDPVSCCFI